MAVAMTPAKQFQIARWPQTDRELWSWVRAVWGITIPNTVVCPGHTTPFRAFADAYFARYPTTVWKASRGFGGKTNLLAILCETEAVCLPAQVTILGGSGAQSLNVHQSSQEAWHSPHAPKHLLTQPPTKFDTHFTTGAWIRSLMASQTSVRGPHPQRLRLDEIDEMDQEILEGAQGQPMRGRKGQQAGIETQTVMSSTHQHPDGTMTAMLNRAAERGWPVYEWCISRGAIVTTSRGDVKIEDVTMDDQVLTRGGWRSVQHVTLMGVKQTVDVVLASGKVLSCTPDHRVAVPGGWCEAGSLAPGSVVLTLARPAVTPPVRCNVGVVDVVGVTVRTDRLTRPAVVPAMRGRVDGTQVTGPDAKAHTAQVIDLHPGEVDPHQAQDSTVDQLLPPSLPVDQAVAVALADSALPDPAASGLICAFEEVVDVRHGAIVPVYDIGVHDDHEFVANGVVVHNCYRETSNPIDGWLTNDEIERKKTEVPQAMWDAEYDLQEPSFEGRAIDVAAVEACFDPSLGETDEDQWLADPASHHLHVTGVDWAKERDLTVIATFDTQGPGGLWICRGWASINRQPWPVMVGRAETRLRNYPGYFAHDATGIGNVISDYFDPDLKRKNRRRWADIVLGGASRATIFSDYIAAIEDHKIRYPRIARAYQEHKYVTMKDLFGSGHPPDSFVAGAVAWAMRDRLTKGTPQVEGMHRAENPWDLVARRS